MDNLEILDSMKKYWNNEGGNPNDVYRCIDAGCEDNDLDSFYGNGYRDVYELLCDEDFNTGSCLEIGCGAGRLTKWLSCIFDEVIGVDVSEAMVNRAEKNLQLDNVVFVSNNGEDLSFLRDNSIDFIFSYIVLQHVPRKDIVLKYLEESYRVLKSGGSSKIHVLDSGKFPIDDNNIDKYFWYGAGVSDEEIRKVCPNALMYPAQDMDGKKFVKIVKE